MQKILVLACLLWVLSLKPILAQFSFSFEMGTNLVQYQNLNTVLNQEGLQSLQPVNFSAGFTVFFDYDEIMFNYLNAVTFFQSRNPDENNGFSLSGASIGVGLGFKLITKEKSTFSLLTGVDMMNRQGGAHLRIRRQTPEAGSLTDQISMPSTTLNELRFFNRTSLHVGLLYTYNLGKYEIGIKGGHHFRMAQTRWAIGDKNLTEGVNVNPLGTYTALLLKF